MELIFFFRTVSISVVSILTDDIIIQPFAETRNSGIFYLFSFLNLLLLSILTVTTLD